MVKEKQDTETLDFEIEFYEKLLKKQPAEISVLIPLGDVYTKRGLYEKGLLIDQKLVTLKPEEPIFYYNLACSFSLVKKKREALKNLKKAFELGYQDFEFIKQDKDLDNIRFDSQFNHLIKKYKKSLDT